MIRKSLFMVICILIMSSCTKYEVISKIGKNSTHGVLEIKGVIAGYRKTQETSHAFYKIVEVGDVIVEEWPPAGWLILPKEESE